MRTSSIRRPAHAGFVSYVMVLSTGVMLTLLMVFAYRSALQSQSVQAGVVRQIDYSEKEDNILRAIVANTPNKAIRAMQSGSNTSSVRPQLTWERIFRDALAQADAGQAASPGQLAGLGLEGSISANPGDTSLTNIPAVFGVTNASGPWVDKSGLNVAFNSSYPPYLNCSHSTVNDRDKLYPIISHHKVYGSRASGRVGLPVNPYSRHNIIPYPKINFGYAKPGEGFVAKRNWWSFFLNLAADDQIQTRLVRPSREFVLSIYEIPSQLAISASAFTDLGTHSSGDAWENVSIEGNIFASRARVSGEVAFESLASRRGMELSTDAVIGGQQFAGNPFRPGVREQFEVAQENLSAAADSYFPLSLPSESGRAAFVPISRGASFFDRFEEPEEATDTALSPRDANTKHSTWNSYSLGALQCAMQLDIADCQSKTNPTPTVLRFSYLKNNVRVTSLLPQVTGIVSTLPEGYVKVADENQSYNFGSQVVDVAYGMGSSFYFQTGVSGTVAFTNDRFGDPLVGTFKAGYYRPAKPFEIKNLPSGKICLAVYPQRFPAFLSRIGADNTSANHSIVVNVDYQSSVRLTKPGFPSSVLDYGVILEECADFTGFPKGFSLVTNLRLYIGDDFNVVPKAPPAGYSPPGEYYPPTSLFAPEKRYGVEADPFALQLAGQVGSLASEDAAEPVHLMDSLGVSGQPIDSKRIRAELSQIRHPEELPPVTMMNWLIVVEERRREFNQ
jgi:hypothetical protein